MDWKNPDKKESSVYLMTSFILNFIKGKLICSNGKEMRDFLKTRSKARGKRWLQRGIGNFKR